MKSLHLLQVNSGLVGITLSVCKGYNSELAGITFSVCKGYRGCLVESKSLRSIFFITELLILGLDFRLFPCKRLSVNIDKYYERKINTRYSRSVLIIIA